MDRTLDREGLFFVQYEDRTFAVMAYNSDDAWRQTGESLQLAMYKAQVMMARTS